ncbi:MAG: imidazole glycerol phosphate synthase subunit HisH [Coriobacteriia bacterium]|nr:imidazole glycerol phosphate synthase subunit HisH [Coriobacteriia bacterium]
MIAVVDYGMGNLRSVQKGFEHAGVSDVMVTGDAAAVAAASAVVLPGVGAFGDASARLRASGMWDVVLGRIAAGTPFLGICLGMQLLADVGYEDGEHPGLGVVPGACERLPDGVKVPHIGWNTVDHPRPSRLFEGVPPGSAFYFVHSYVLIPEDPSCIIGETAHGVPFAAAVQKRDAFAVQFHPEKSSALGLRVLGNFGRIAEEGA